MLCIPNLKGHNAVRKTRAVVKKGSGMGFPGTWMTESESVVYRVVPKCACSTIGQINFYSDHGRFFDGDIHDAKNGMDKWAIEASQEPIT